MVFGLFCLGLAPAKTAELPVGDEILFEKLQQYYYLGLWDGKFASIGTVIERCEPLASDKALLLEAYPGGVVEIDGQKNLLINGERVYNINMMHAFLLDSEVAAGKISVQDGGVWSIQGGFARLDVLPTYLEGESMIFDTAQIRTKLPRGTTDAFIISCQPGKKVGRTWFAQNLVVGVYQGETEKFSVYTLLGFSDWTKVAKDVVTARKEGEMLFVTHEVGGEEEMVNLAPYL